MLDSNRPCSLPKRQRSDGGLAALSKLQTKREAKLKKKKKKGGEGGVFNTVMY